MWVINSHVRVLFPPLDIKIPGILYIKSYMEIYRIGVHSLRVENYGLRIRQTNFVNIGSTLSEGALCLTVVLSDSMRTGSRDLIMAKNHLFVPKYEELFSQRGRGYTIQEIPGLRTRNHAVRVVRSSISFA